eukprot:COSAG01_NODE_14416_length_1456_cov_1.633014_2_plen_114_part_00
MRRFPSSACLCRRACSAKSRNLSSLFLRMFATLLRAFWSSLIVAESIFVFVCSDYVLVENVVDNDSVREGFSVLVEELGDALMHDPHDELGVVLINDGVSRINGEAPGGRRRV